MLVFRIVAMHLMVRPCGRRAGAWLLSLAVIASSGCNAAVEQRHQPNVVFIVVDDLRADHLTTYRYHRDTAPFLDELARRGVVFENAVSPSSWTKTSMASILSSLNPDAHGVRNSHDVLSNEVVLLPELLHATGYQTLCVHGNPWMEAQFGFNQGYDYFVYSHWTADDISGERVKREAVKWLRTEPREPFFIYLHFMDVHAPFQAPEGYDLFGTAPQDSYDASIFYVDAQLRWLYEKLAALGVLEETWFVFTSDHGEGFGEHGPSASGHGSSLYHEVLHVPLIFHHARYTAKGHRVARQVRLIDVAPTILDLVSIEPPDPMDGVSLRSDLDGDGTGRDLIAISRVGGNDVAPDKDLFSFSTREFKYIVDFASGSEELYDRVSDPGETRNLAELHPELLSSLREKALRETERSRRVRGDGESLPEIDDALRERLRALGYLR